MPKRLGEHRFEDWLHFRPLTRRARTWLHEVGTNDRPVLTAEKRAIVAARLAPHLGEQ